MTATPFLLGATAAFVIGLRHGADPDHIAAIDNLTRSSFTKQPLLSRFVGTLFAFGHSVMVLAIAALVGLLGASFGAYHDRIETIGTWISIAVLLLIGVMNLRQLALGRTTMTGYKTRMLPRRLLAGKSALVALPVGFLFGFGFETSSQIAAAALALDAGSGWIGGLAIGAVFSLGMIVTDTFDSVIVHRLVSDRSSVLPTTMRVWIWSVTIVAFLVAGYELGQVLGWHSPIPDIAVTGLIVGALLAVFAYVFIATRTGDTASRSNRTAPRGDNL